MAQTGMNQFAFGLIMKTKIYCPFCAERLTDRYLEGRERRFCPRCDKILYANPIPATCLVVTASTDQILLVKRGIPPNPGDWCLPGGYIEMDESPSNGAVRELKEETGLNGEIHQLLGVIKAHSPIYGSLVMVGYHVCRFQGELKAGDDAEKAAFFAIDDIPPVAFKSHRHFVRQVYADAPVLPP